MPLTTLTSPELPRATTCVGPRNTRQSSVGPVRHRRICVFLNAAISRTWHQASPAYAKRPARHGSTPSSPDVCIRKRDCPPFIPCAGQACRASVLALLESLTTSPPGSPPQPDKHAQLLMAVKCLAASIRPAVTEVLPVASAVSVKDGSPPTLMQRSAVPPTPRLNPEPNRFIH